MASTAKFVILILLLALPLAAAAAPDGENSRPYVILTLTDKTEIKLDFDSFSIPWVSTDIREELSCKASHFEMTDVSEVLVLNVAWNDCLQRNEWLFDVYFKDGRRPLRGFMEVQETQFRGRAFSAEPLDGLDSVARAGDLRAFPFASVDKILFYYGGE